MYFNCVSPFKKPPLLTGLRHKKCAGLLPVQWHLHPIVKEKAIHYPLDTKCCWWSIYSMHCLHINHCKQMLPSSTDLRLIWQHPDRLHIHHQPYSAQLRCQNPKLSSHHIMGPLAAWPGASSMAKMEELRTIKMALTQTCSDTYPTLLSCWEQLLFH